MRRSPSVLAGLLAFALVAGCGSSGPTASTTTTRPRPGSSPVITIRTAGGFVPSGADFANVPVVVLADATAFTGGAVPAIYPGPPISPVVTGGLGAGTLRSLLDDARQAGLDHDGLDAGTPPVADLGTTTITVVLDGHRHTDSVYALGFDGNLDRLTPAQRTVRADLTSFATAVQDRVMQVATSPYAPSAYQAFVLAADPTSGSSQDPRPNELAWPFADLPLRDHACLDIDAAHASTFAAALAHATQITIWRDAAQRPWHVVARVVLPGDGPCSYRGR